MDTCEISETYEGLRDSALRCRASDLGITRVAKRPIWRVMMEVGSRDGVTTLVVTDDASLDLFSTQGELVGLQGADWPHEAGARLIGAAGDVLFDCVPTWAFPLPDPGKIRFYLFTFGGVLAAEAVEAELATGKAPLSRLYYAGHDALTLARLITEDDQWAAYEAALGDVGTDAEEESTLDEDLEAEILALGPEESATESEEAAAATPAVLLETTPAVAPAVLLEPEPTPPAADTPEPSAAVAAEPPAAEQPAACNVARPPAPAETPAATEPQANQGSDGSPGRDPLVQAVIDDDAGAVAALLARGHDLTAESGGFTPLMAAAYVGAAEPLRLLLKAGAPVDAHGRHGFTALMCACNADHAECARLLLDSGADVSTRDAEGSTPLIFAAQHGSNDIVRLLMGHGADPTTVGAHSLSAVGFAAKKGHESTVAILLGQAS